MGVVANELMNLKDNLPEGILKRRAEWRSLQYNGKYDNRSVTRFLEKHLKKSTDTKIDYSTVSDFLRLTAGVKQNQVRIMDHGSACKKIRCLEFGLGSTTRRCGY